MILPGSLYRDPALVVAQDEALRARERWGCSACTHFSPRGECDRKVVRPQGHRWCRQWRWRDGAL